LVRPQERARQSRAVGVAEGQRVLMALSLACKMQINARNTLSISLEHLRSSFHGQPRKNNKGFFFLFWPVK